MDKLSIDIGKEHSFISLLFISYFVAYQGDYVVYWSLTCSVAKTLLSYMLVCSRASELSTRSMSAFLSVLDTCALGGVIFDDSREVLVSSCACGIYSPL